MMRWFLVVSLAIGMCPSSLWAYTQKSMRVAVRYDNGVTVKQHWTTPAKAIHAGYRLIHAPHVRWIKVQEKEMILHIIPFRARCIITILYVHKEDVILFMPPSPSPLPHPAPPSH